MNITESKVGDGHVIVICRAFGRKHRTHVDNQAAVGCTVAPTAMTVEGVDLYAVNKQVQHILLCPFHRKGELIAHCLIQLMRVDVTIKIEYKHQSVHSIDNTVGIGKTVTIRTPELTGTTAKAGAGIRAATWVIGRAVGGQDR